MSIKIISGGHRRLNRAKSALSKRLARATTDRDRAIIKQLIADMDAAQRRGHDQRAKEAAEASVRSRRAPPPRITSMSGPDYMAFLAGRRLNILKGQSKDVIAAQPEMYKLAGIDPRAGFEGKPPAFIPSTTSRTGMRNAARDPMRKMFLAGYIAQHHYDASCEIQDLYERYNKAGMRTNGIPELIDGGKAPDVSVEVMSAVSAFRQYEQAISETHRALLHAVVIEGVPLTAVASTGRFGRDRNALSVMLKSALDAAAIFFGLLLPPKSEAEEADDVQA